MVECNICGWASHSFQPLWEHPSVICPQCGSFERHRALAYYLEQTKVLTRAARVLETGNGETVAFKTYLERNGSQYFSVDLWPGYGSVRATVAALPFQSNTFDVVISMHVIEHLHDDFTALAEMFRVVKENGLTIVQVPYDDSRFDTVENDVEPALQGTSEYYHHHKRDYGLDIIERLKFFGMHVAEVHPLLLISKAEAVKHSFENNFGTTFFCSRSARVNSYPGQLKRVLRPLKLRWLIERRAYVLYQSRNGDGNCIEDWLQAEAEIEQLTNEELARENVLGSWARDKVGPAEEHATRRSQTAG